MAVTMRINKDHNGIELIFPDTERPDAALRTTMKKEYGFRWYNEKKYWYAKQTPERLAFAQKLTGAIEKEVPAQKEPENKELEKMESEPQKGKRTSKKEKAAKTENTFASVYDSIGGIEIRESSDFSLHDIPREGVYCKDTQTFFRHTWGLDDVITVVDLTNAGKNGQNCPSWKLYPLDGKGITSNFLVNDENLKTCTDLLKALQEGKTLDSVKVYPREDKGIETFSPFVEVKPLTKMPETWNKRNFTNAVLSGQIYMGQLDYRYTDDYAYDAAYNFGEGCGINIPVFARDVVEDWSSTNYVRSGHVDDKKHCTISFSEHSNTSKTLYFDLDCDIREGKRRADEKAAGIKAYNAMMEASCVKLRPESIDENKIYSVTSLDMNGNTGVYGIKTELMQGSSLMIEANAPELSYIQILSINPQDIQPDHLYEVASFYRPRTYAEPDDRIIDMGNSQQLVTGKALLELTAEGIPLPHIQEAVGENCTIESARENLKKYISGDRFLMFTGLKTHEYEKALDKLNREAERAGHKEVKRSSVNDLIASAQKKAAQNSAHTQEKTYGHSR